MAEVAVSRHAVLDEEGNRVRQRTHVDREPARHRYLGSIEFIRMACSKQWQLRSMERGNAPPRGSVLNDPAMAEKLGWPPTAARAIETGVPTPAHPTWSTLELALRTGVSETLQGQKTAKQALDAVAADWQRTLRRAGIGRA
jgi:multiple sugar transport system substrate-binding protein